MSCKHITSEQRNKLSVLLRTGIKQKEIAKILRRSEPAISKEIKRNSINGKYHARIAKEKTKERRVINWIYEGRNNLVKYLRCKKGNYRRRYGTRIRERPEIVEERARIGDWEGDTVIGKERTRRLLTNVDRKSGYGLIDKLDLVSAELVWKKLEERFSKIPENKKHTYTYDNGTEIGKEDSCLEKKIKMDVFRAFAYHSWERGCNENFNGLVREFFPKKTKFANISKKEVQEVERLLNNRPRKRLNYYTPREVFFRKKLKISK